MNAIGRIWATAAASAIFAGVGFGATAPAQATVIDPNFTVCANTTNDTCGAHPNLISGSGSFNSFTFGNSGAGPLDPFLILVAVPDTSAGVQNLLGGPVFNANNAPGITVAAAAGTVLYSAATPVIGADGYIGELSSTPVNCDDLYCFAGLNNGNSSESFASFNSTSGGTPPEQQLLGYLPEHYSVYAFLVTVTPGVGNNLGNGLVYNIPYDSLALGSFVAAYGVESCTTSSTDNKGNVTPCSDSGHVYDSAFTVSGWVGSSSGGPITSGFAAPEPGTLALFSLALLALGLGSRRRSILA